MTERILIDWKEVGSISEFYDLVLPQLIAPDWHGRNLDALNDSLVTGGVNGLEPPFTIVSLNTPAVRESIREFQSEVMSIFELVAKERQIEIQVN